MITKLFAATQSPNWDGNWGKFLVCIPEDEMGIRSELDTELKIPVIRTRGWGPNHVLVLDLETGEGAIFRLGGYAKADLDKTHIWVCPLFESFLTWLYRYKTEEIPYLPQLVFLPEAEFAFHGYRRTGGMNGLGWPGKEQERR